jgi:hypothetical protein
VYVTDGALSVPDIGPTNTAPLPISHRYDTGCADVETVYPRIVVEAVIGGTPALLTVAHI